MGASEVTRAPASLLIGGVFVLVALLLPGGCFQVAGYDAFTFQEPFRGRLVESTVDKIDLLFVIDNSRGIADKHEILRETLEAFIGRLVNPRCVDATDGTPASQPDSTSEACPAGQRRELAPVRNMHIGIITTSLGGHGAEICGEDVSPTNNDRAHLIDRVAVGSPERVPTYEGLGFLAWDPDSRESPPGDDDIDELVENLSAIVGGIGELGCGFEAPLEAWYRFLVEPEPHLDVVVEDNVAIPTGNDDVLLAQRAAFVRPDSLLAIVMMTDENDCSIRDGGGFYIAGQVYQPNGNDPYHLPRPRAACAIDPHDPCCRSCGQDPGKGCDTSNDPCDQGNLSPLEDNINLRCFDQKRRFGTDFLYPPDRYVTGLTSAEVPNRAGELVQNPLLAGRPAGRVVLAGILGVPWQDIARTDADGVPDLRAGRDVLGTPVGGVKNASELLRPVGEHANTWSIILGDPAHDVPPADPFMIESVDPRAGAHPITGEALTAPAAESPSTINGGEYTIPQRDDLQHACFFPGKDCSQSEDPTCKAGRGQSCTVGEDDCREGLACVPADSRCGEECVDGGPFGCTCGENDPLCRDANGAFTQFQYAESAYPGIRLLSVLRQASGQGIVGSICPAQVDDVSLPDFGFTPALNGAIVERLKGSLKEHLCLDRSLLPDQQGFVDCVLIEAREEAQGDACRDACTTTGRRPATDVHADAVALAADDTARKCFCEIQQVATPSDVFACQTYLSEPVSNAFGQPVDAWCFIDAMSNPRVGAPELTAGCPNDRRRIIRLSGAAQQAPGSRLYLHCN